MNKLRIFSHLAHCINGSSFEILIKKGIGTNGATVSSMAFYCRSLFLVCDGHFSIGALF